MGRSYPTFFFFRKLKEEKKEKAEIKINFIFLLLRTHKIGFLLTRSEIEFHGKYIYPFTLDQMLLGRKKCFPLDLKTIFFES